ncbi:hypothetical protein SDJN03_28524, partial [Cucurbita argyrosperma subsp. sororia]
MYVTDMDVFKNLDPGTSNVDLENEGQPVEETAPAEAVSEPAAQSASRDQPTVVITLEALQSLIESRVDQAMQSRVDQAVQAALAGLGSQAAPTAPVSGQTTLVSETPEVGVQTVTPPTRLTELPGTAVVTEAPSRMLAPRGIIRVLAVRYGQVVNENLFKYPRVRNSRQYHNELIAGLIPVKGGQVVVGVG